MTTVEASERTHEAPPQMLSPNPRPSVDTLKRGSVVAALVAVPLVFYGTVSYLPAVWQSLWGYSEPEPVYDTSPRLYATRGRTDLPSGYGEMKTAPQPEPQAAEAPQPQQPQQQVIIRQQGSARPAGPTKAQMLRNARMSNIVSVKPVRGEAQQVSMNGGAGPAGGAARPSGKLYNPNGLTPAFDCQVDAGTNIPAMTEQRLTSESPGTVSAVAMRDIWSSDKTCLAVPRGTRFVGRYQTAVAEGQVRMGIIWTGLTRPPPRKDTIELNDTVAGDPDGTAGVTGEVNSHFWKKLAYVTAASLLDIGKTAITAGGEGGIGAAVAGIFADRAASPIDDWAKRQLDIPPVIEVAPREISITLAQHLPMDDFRGGR